MPNMLQMLRLSTCWDCMHVLVMTGIALAAAAAAGFGCTAVNSYASSLATDLICTRTAAGAAFHLQQHHNGWHRWVLVSDMHRIGTGCSSCVYQVTKTIMTRRSAARLCGVQAQGAAAALSLQAAVKQHGSNLTPCRKLAACPHVLTREEWNQHRIRLSLLLVAFCALSFGYICCWSNNAVRECHRTQPGVRKR
jgi:hypothetical protein